MELQRQANKIWWGHHQRVGHLENRRFFTVIRIQFFLILARGWAAGQEAVAVSGSVSERVYVLQCVTSGKLLSADLHNTVFPLSLRKKKKKQGRLQDGGGAKQGRWQHGPGGGGGGGGGMTWMWLKSQVSCVNCGEAPVVSLSTGLACSPTPEKQAPVMAGLQTK